MPGTEQYDRPVGTTYTDKVSNLQLLLNNPLIFLYFQMAWWSKNRNAYITIENFRDQNQKRVVSLISITLSGGLVMQSKLLLTIVPDLAFNHLHTR